MNARNVVFPSQVHGRRALCQPWHQPSIKPFNDDDDNIYRLDSIISQRNWCGGVWCPKKCLQGLPKNQARYLLKTVLWRRTTLLKYADPLKTSLSQKHCRWGKQHIRGVFMRWWWSCGPCIPSLCSSPDILEDNSYLTWLLVSINPKKTVKVFSWRWLLCRFWQRFLLASLWETIICHSTETFPWQVINHTLRNTSVPYCAKFV